MKKIISVFIMLMMTAIINLYAAVINPNPIISRGKTVTTSSGTAAYLVDNNFTGTNFNVANNTWIAINIGTGHSSVYISWNNPAYTWSDVIAAAGSCKSTPSMPVNYTIQTSANSTNGTDGTWTTTTTITGNNVSARGHVINSTGASWVKMNISTGRGQINEVEVFDLSSGGTDLWFFPGTSITANTYKATPPAQDYADLIKASYPAFTPMMVRGGIPCINSTQFKNDINLYLASAGNVKYWAIEMGTNDAWGGSNGGVSTFKNNMQAIITACKNAGIQPVIARMLSTNASLAKWQVHPDYLKAIDDLATQNNLTPGPDLYTYFLSHTSELNSDGVHPNATGAASIQRLWAQKMGPLLYSSPLNTTPTVTLTSPVNASLFCVGTAITINATAAISSGSISKIDFYDGTTLLGSDNSSPYSYTWNNPATGIHTVRTIATSAAGTISSAASISITVNALPVIDYYAQIDGGTWNQITGVAVCAGSTLALGPHPVSTTGWSWMGPNGYTAAVREITLSNIAASQAGTYTASYTDANGCNSKSPITVIVNTLPSAPVVTTALAYCQNATAIPLTAIGTGLKWYTGASVGTALSTAPTPVTTAIGTTNYYLSQTVNGCESTRSLIAVTVNALTIATISSSTATTFCEGGSVLLSASTGSSYKWMNGNTQVGTAATYSATAAGNYTVEVTNANGCKAASAAKAVTVNALSIATISSSTATTFCAGGSVLLTSGSGTSYKWLDGTAQVGTGATYSAATSGNYTVEVTNADNCKATSAATTVKVNALPTANISSSTATTFCEGGSVLLSASTGSSYKWINGNAQVGTAATYSATTSGNYTVEVTSANGCKAISAAKAVAVNALPTANISSSTATTFCEGGSVLLSASTGSSYKWMNGNAQVGTAVTYSATTAGNYTIEVTNANGCKATSTTTIITVTAPITWYADADGDGKGDAAVTQTACAKPSGYVSTAGDFCPADANKTSAGFCGCGNTELDSDDDTQPDCIDTDDDNDGIADANDCAPLNANTGAALTWYADSDGDGKGDAAITQTSCTQPAGYVSIAGDLCPSDATKITAGDCGCGNTETSCMDCAGIVNGTASIDVCNKCSGGTTGIIPITDETNCATTGVVDLKSTDAIKVMPNPSSEEFTLILTQVSEVQILAADGKLVDSFHNVSNLNFGAAYAKGVYFVQINTANTTQILRIVKL